MTAITATLHADPAFEALMQVGRAGRLREPVAGPAAGCLTPDGYPAACQPLIHSALPLPAYPPTLHAPQRVQPRGLADRTHPLLLAHELADAEAEVGATGNPVLDLIEGISRGLSVAAVQVGEVSEGEMRMACRAAALACHV